MDLTQSPYTVSCILTPRLCFSLNVYCVIEIQCVAQESIAAPGFCSWIHVGFVTLGPQISGKGFSVGYNIGTSESLLLTYEREHPSKVEEVLTIRKGRLYICCYSDFMVLWEMIKCLA